MRLITKAYSEALWCEGNILPYVNDGGVYTAVYTCQNS